MKSRKLKEYDDIIITEHVILKSPLKNLPMLQYTPYEDECFYLRFYIHYVDAYNIYTLVLTTAR